jgi:hypothetical protein
MFNKPYLLYQFFVYFGKVLKVANFFPGKPFYWFPISVCFCSWQRKEVKSRQGGRKAGRRAGRQKGRQAEGQAGRRAGRQKGRQAEGQAGRRA